MEKVTIETEIYEIEIECGYDLTVITTAKGLEDALDNFMGKKVKITIELSE